MPRPAGIVSEDVAIGVWIALVNHTIQSLPVSITATNCSPKYSQTVLDHKVTPEMMRARWRNFTKTGDTCWDGSPRPNVSNSSRHNASNHSAVDKSRHKGQ